jgi:hypothetical protein
VFLVLEAFLRTMIFFFESLGVLFVLIRRCLCGPQDSILRSRTLQGSVGFDLLPHFLFSLCKRWSLE